MAASHYYCFEFLPDDDLMKIPSIKYPLGVTPVIPTIGSLIHARGTNERLVHGELASVSWGFKPTYTLIALHLKDAKFSVDNEGQPEKTNE